MRLLSTVYVAGDFSNVCASVSSGFVGVDGLGGDGWYFPGVNDYFSVLFGFVNLSELVKYLRVERYLAAKIGTISLVLLWWVVFITYG